MSDSEGKTEREKDYDGKRISIHAYLSKTGEFQWVPASKACCDKESAKMILEVLREMPADRRSVWEQRFDREDTMARCPVIRKEPELSKEFDEFFAACDRKKLKASQEKDGGENTK